MDADGGGRGGHGLMDGCVLLLAEVGLKSVKKIMEARSDLKGGIFFTLWMRLGFGNGIIRR